MAAGGKEDDDEDDDPTTGGTVSSAWGFGPATPRPAVILLLAGDAAPVEWLRQINPAGSYRLYIYCSLICFCRRLSSFCFFALFKAGKPPHPRFAP